MVMFMALIDELVGDIVSLVFDESLCGDRFDR